MLRRTWSSARSRVSAPGRPIPAAEEIERTLPGGLEDNLLVFRIRGSDGSWHELGGRGRAGGADPPRLLVNARDVSERVRSEHLRASVRRISDAALATSTPDELYAALHRIVDDLMPARNFYIALYDPAGDQLSFPYWRDEFDPVSPPKKPGRGPDRMGARGGATPCWSRRRSSRTGRE